MLILLQKNIIQHFHDIKNMPLERFNTNHYFDVLSFGDEYPNQFNPLEKKSLASNPPSSMRTTKKAAEANNDNPEALFEGFLNFGFFGIRPDGGNDGESKSDSVSYSYFLKIVPTTYEYLDGKIVNNTYQYSVTRSAKVTSNQNTMSSQLPGVFISFDLAPIMVKYIEKARSFTHFLTSCCAIIGGLFTVAGMLDAFAFRSYNMYKKHQINKLT